MSAATGIPNHPPGAPPGAGSILPMASSAQPSDGSATITANDFLTLLVTEMQNQDPTANTDPNEYINQLVQVNSLEQLIAINQTLGAALGPAGGTANPSAQAAGRRAAPMVPAPAAAAREAAPPAASAPPAFGNLSVPAANPAALRVAHALDGSRAEHFAGPAAVRR